MGQIMKWITAKQLEYWADNSASSASTLSGIISDLIRATTGGIRTIRFPSGDKGQVRGFDGHLISRVEAFNVPLGESFWEFGTGSDYIPKANKDFEKRSKEISTDRQQQSSFVFVSTRTWDSSQKDNKLEDWVQKQLKKYSWKNIYFIDGVQLETWLEQCPAVAAWHAKNTLKVAPQSGIRSTNEFWEDFSGRFNPPLTEEVLLCERENDAKDTIRALLASKSLQRYVADTDEEVIAFVVAAIRKAKPRIRLLLEAKTLVIDSLEAGRYCLSSPSPLAFLLRGDAAKSPSQFAQCGSTIVPVTLQQKNIEAHSLRRPYIHELADSLRSMGFSHADANKYAYGSGRSLTALARLIPSGSAPAPVWLDSMDLLLPVILINSWNTDYKLDKEVVQEFTDKAYDTYDSLLRMQLLKPEYPIEFEGGVWKSRTPLDSLIHIGHLITDNHLKKLEKIIIQVFSQEEPDLSSLSFQEQIELPQTSYSTWLREGLAQTLLMIAVWGKNENLFPYLSKWKCEHFAERIVSHLLQQSDAPLIDHELLSYFAEASPKIFLNILEKLIQQSNDWTGFLFTEKVEYGIPSGKHTYLLFALERLAWLPEYFEQVTVIMAHLAHIDPGGQLGNRPIRSLVDIFCLEIPNTHASLEQKKHALESIIAQHEDIGWKILVSLLPELHRKTSFIRAKPRFRDAGELPSMTYQQLWDVQDEMALKVIELAAFNLDKLKVLTKRLPVFSDEIFSKVVSALDDIFPTLPDAKHEAFWGELKEQVDFNQRIMKNANNSFSLKLEQIKVLEMLLNKHVPSNPFFEAIYTFSQAGYSPHSDSENNQKKQDNLLKEIIKGYGITGLFELVLKSKHIYEITCSLSRIDLTIEFLKEIIVKAIKEPTLFNLAIYCYAMLLQKIEAQEVELWTKENIAYHGWDDEIIASLLYVWPENTSTWHMVRRFGQTIYERYWKYKNAFRYDGNTFSFYRLILMNLKFGHAYNAMINAYKKYNDLPIKLISRIFDNLVVELNKKPEMLSNQNFQVAYHIERVLDELEKRKDTNKNILLKYEFALLPVLLSRRRKLYIYTEMASNPECYYSIFEVVWGEREAADAKKDADIRTLYYQLLDNFHNIPGHQNDEIDSSFLSEWIDRVRSLSSDTNFANLQDNSIGELLAHCIKDPKDGAWPHQAIREQIERLKNEHIEDGICIERFNMRGAHWVDRENPGKQEKQLASTYREYAEITLSKWPQTSSLLQRIAENWISQAEQEEIRARQEKMKY